MSRFGRALAGAAAALCCAVALLSGCEKGTRWAAEREYRALQDRRLGEEEAAAALGAFVERFPEPKTNPYLTTAYLRLAAHHDQGQRYEIAASWYERALRVNPDDPDLMNSLGYLYARHGMNLDRAVQLLETAVRLAAERDSPARRQGFIKDSLGWAYRARGDLPQAVVVLEEARRLAPGVTIIAEHLAETYRDIGETERASALYLDLYLAGRGADRRLRGILEELDGARPGGPSPRIGRLIQDGLEAIAASDREEAASEGAGLLDLEAADGHPLRGSLYLPAGGGGGRRRGAVLLLHALGSSRKAASGLARRLAAGGLVALALDVRGHGASVDESIPSARAFSASLRDNLRGAGLDGRAGLEALERHPRVDPARIGAVGAGMGALLAARALASDPPLPSRALVLISPWGIPAAYLDPLERLDAEGLLLVAGEEEEGALATIRSLSRARGLGDERLVAVRRNGSGFELADSEDRIASFLLDRLR